MGGIMITSWGKGPLAASGIERSYSDMSTPNITRWIGIGLLGLPLYGVMTFFSSIDPQPDPKHPLRVLGSLRHYRRLRAQAPLPYPPWHHFRDLRHDRPRSLPNQNSGRTYGVVGHGHNRAGLLSVVDLGWGLYLLRALRGADCPSGHGGGDRRAAHHLGEHPAGGDRSGFHRARVRGQRALGRSGLALWDPAQVGRGPVGVRTRFDVHLRHSVRADDRRPGHPT